MKKPVKTTKKAPSKAISQPSHRSWKVYWIRNVVNDEFVAYAKPTTKGFQMMEPTIITTYDNTMLLAPYGTMSKDPGVFLKNEHVIHCNEVTDVMRDLYVTSVATSGDFVQKSFDTVIRNSIDVALRSAEYIETPSSKGVVVTQKGDSQENSIDRLMRLAEEVGKGKKN